MKGKFWVRPVLIPLFFTAKVGKIYSVDREADPTLLYGRDKATFFYIVPHKGNFEQFVTRSAPV